VVGTHPLPSLSPAMDMPMLVTSRALVLSMCLAHTVAYPSRYTGAGRGCFVPVSCSILIPLHPSARDIPDHIFIAHTYTFFAMAPVHTHTLHTQHTSAADDARDDHCATALLFAHQHKPPAVDMPIIEACFARSPLLIIGAGVVT
jgi:hypothetical protein